MFSFFCALVTNARVAGTGAKVTDVCGLFSDGTVTLFSACASSLSAAAFISFFSPVRVDLGYNSHITVRVSSITGVIFSRFSGERSKNIDNETFH